MGSRANTGSRFTSILPKVKFILMIPLGSRRLIIWRILLTNFVATTRIKQASMLYINTTKIPTKKTALNAVSILAILSYENYPGNSSMTLLIMR